MSKKFFTLLILFVTVAVNAQNFKIEANQLVLDKPVIFKAGTAELQKESEEVLTNVKKFLDDKTYVSTLRIEGHVFSSEKDKDQALSEQRAMAVTQWLVKNGADCKRLLAVGFGNTKPMVANDSPNAAGNTRIVFAIAALRGHAIGGMPLDGGGQLAGNACE